MGTSPATRLPFNLDFSSPLQVLCDNQSKPKDFNSNEIKQPASLQVSARCSSSDVASKDLTASLLGCRPLRRNGIDTTLFRLGIATWFLTMATTTSVSPTSVERSGSRRGQSQSMPSRSQSTRTKITVPPSPQRAHSGHNRTSSRHGAVEEVLAQRDGETTNVAQTSRRSSTSKDRPLPSRNESGKSTSDHHRPHRSRHSSDMATTAAHGAGPAPVVTPTESRQTGRSSGKSRTTIPAPTGDWVLGKTIGAGSMGKVKLARRVEGGEQVHYTNLCKSID